MADQVAGDNVLVNAVLPGHYLTDRQKELSEIRARDRGITAQQYLDESLQHIPMHRFGRCIGGERHTQGVKRLVIPAHAGPAPDQLQGPQSQQTHRDSGSRPE